MRDILCFITLFVIPLGFIEDNIKNIAIIIVLRSVAAQYRLLADFQARGELFFG